MGSTIKQERKRDRWIISGNKRDIFFIIYDLKLRYISRFWLIELGNYVNQEARLILLKNGNASVGILAGNFSERDRRVSLIKKISKKALKMAKKDTASAESVINAVQREIDEAPLGKDLTPFRSMLESVEQF